MHRTWTREGWFSMVAKRLFIFRVYGLGMHRTWTREGRFSMVAKRLFRVEG